MGIVLALVGLGAFLLMLILSGLLSGVAPARRDIRIDPIEALHAD